MIDQAEVDHVIVNNSSSMTDLFTGMDLLGGVGGVNPHSPGQMGCRGVLFL
jgi:hypothetical protein